MAYHTYKMMMTRNVYTRLLHFYSIFSILYIFFHPRAIRAGYNDVNVTIKQITPYSVKLFVVKEEKNWHFLSPALSHSNSYPSHMFHNTRSIGWQRKTYQLVNILDHAPLNLFCVCYLRVSSPETHGMGLQKKMLLFNLLSLYIQMPIYEWYNVWDGIY